MIRYMQQVKELLLKNRLQISTYLTRVEHTGFTLYAKSSELSYPHGINEGYTIRAYPICQVTELDHIVVVIITTPF